MSTTVLAPFPVGHELAEAEQKIILSYIKREMAADGKLVLKISREGMNDLWYLHFTEARTEITSEVYVHPNDRDLMGFTKDNAKWYARLLTGGLK